MVTDGKDSQYQECMEPAKLVRVHVTSHVYTAKLAHTRQMEFKYYCIAFPYTDFHDKMGNTVYIKSRELPES